MLAFSRIPGNAFSFWIRRALRWSRGAPTLPHEPKQNLFAYLALPSESGESGEPDDAGDAPDPSDPAAGEAREAALRRQYRLQPLFDASTAALYRKNLYLIDILEQAAKDLAVPEGPRGISALDVGSQDWHYVFGLERWLRFAGSPQRPEGRPVALRGVEVDGYGIYPDFHSRKDYARAYAAQTGNPEVTYEVGDILDAAGGGLDLITIFYPFVTRHHLLLWGLPLRFFRPAQLLAKTAALLKPGGLLLVFTHTLKEHDLLVELGRASGRFELVRQGRALSRLVDFHRDVTDRRFSVWRRQAS
jgi:hypothetical protein